MNPTRILVLGAGELGASVIRHLARRAAEHPDASLTVLLRGSTINSDDPAKRREVYALRALGVDLLAGDVTATADELAEVFHDFDTVICCTGFVGGKGTQLRIAHAVLAAGVKRYFPWQFGVDYEVIGRGSAQAGWDEQLDVRDLLRTQSDTAWVIVSTGMFTSFLFEPSFGVVDLDNDVVHALGSWDNTVTVTAPDDIGALTAEICLFQPTIANSVVYTAGDTISYARLADTGRGRARPEDAAGRVDVAFAGNSEPAPGPRRPHPPVPHGVCRWRGCVLGHGPHLQRAAVHRGRRRRAVDAGEPDVGVGWGRPCGSTHIYG